MHTSAPFTPFNAGRLSDVLDRKRQELRQRVEAEREDYLLSVNLADYVDYLTRSFAIDAPILMPQDESIETEEIDVPSARFLDQFSVLPGKFYRKPLYRYYLPFSGDAEFFRYVPSQYIMRSILMSFHDGCICFEMVDFNGNASTIQGAIGEFKGLLASQVGSTQRDITRYNEELPRLASETAEARKQRILERMQVAATLSIPIKVRTGMPQTYAVPTPAVRKSVHIRKPAVTEHGFSPEPTLDDSTYRDIVQTIHDLGKVFERKPATYSGKHEEDLRDHILLYLEPRYDGSATGETFNKTGKTDILIRHQNSNVFIAECKFWNGPKGYLDTIRQLLGYLTWRDSKAAVVMFVRSKEISTVLSAVEQATPTHLNYLGFVGRNEESWFNFRFHLNGDRNREVKVAVLIIHLPPVE